MAESTEIRHREVSSRASAETEISSVDERYFSKIVGRALSVLEFIRESPRPLSLAELAKKVGMAKSSVFRLLHTLEHSQYIVKDAGGNYVPSNEVDHWSSKAFVENLLQVARPELTRLRSKFGETVSIAVLFDNHIEVVGVCESPQLVRMGNTVGRIIPPHASSIGKSITAHQNEERRETLIRSYGLHRFTKHTITDEMELNKEFEEIVRLGWSRDDEESTLEGCCLGVPIFVMDIARAAISISTPISRRPQKEESEEIIAALKASAKRISAHFPSEE